MPREETSRSRGWPTKLIDTLVGLIRTHENSSVRLVIATHIILVALDISDRATFQNVSYEFPVLRAWAESEWWIILSIVVIAWLMIWSSPPRVIWGLWLSTAVLSGWGLINVLSGLTLTTPVSLAGPAFILGVAAPLAWFTAETFQERVHSEQAQKGLDNAIARHDEST